MRTGPVSAPRLLYASTAAVAPAAPQALTPLARNRVEPARPSRRAQSARMPLDAVSQRIVATTADLVRIPSQGGIDDVQPICDAIVAKLAEAGLSGRVLTREGRPVGVVAEIVGAHPGPTYALNAVVDTAPVGDSKRWSLKPFSAELRGNRLYGRGVGDSKVAASMFIEVGRELARRTEDMHGRAVLFFDAAEHAGDFAGMHTFIDEFSRGDQRVQGMVIGYPGNESLQIGSRGFHRSRWRTTLDTPGAVEEVARAIASPEQVSIPEGRSIAFPMSTKRTLTAVSGAADGVEVGDGTLLDIAIRGKSGHSGSSAPSGVNALVKTTTFLRALHETGATLFGDAFAPQVVGLEGSQDFSVVPDLVRLKLFVPSHISESAARHVVARALAIADDMLPAPAASEVESCTRANGERALTSVTVNTDVRTTLACDPEHVQASIDRAVDAMVRDGVRCEVTTIGSCPAFRLHEGSPLLQAMQKAITLHSPTPVQPRISGPTNAGNVAAGVDMPATAGFGPSCRHMHANDESIDVSTILVAFKVYLEAMVSLFRMKARSPAGMPATANR